MADEFIYVLDACAVVALLEGEPGAEVVESLLQQENSVFLLHAVNACEIFYHTYRRAGEARARGLTVLFQRLNLNLEPSLPSDLWESAGTIKALQARISLADCIALALAIDRGGTLVTSDHHEFDSVAESGICPVQFIR